MVFCLLKIQLELRFGNKMLEMKSMLMFMASVYGWMDGWMEGSFLAVLYERMGGWIKG